MRHIQKLSVVFAALASFALLGGCAAGSAPMSVLEGNLQSPLPFSEYPVRIVAIDGAYQAPGASRASVLVGPGLHSLRVAALGSRSVRSGPATEQTVSLAVEPCTRYYLGAHRDSPFSTNWELQVLSKEAVAGCDRDNEIRKASSTVATR